MYLVGKKNLCRYICYYTCITKFSFILRVFKKHTHNGVTSFFAYFTIFFVSFSFLGIILRFGVGDLTQINELLRRFVHALDAFMANQ